MPDHHGSSEEQRTDEQLVKAANDGDASAFEALYYRHRDWVVSHAWRLTHHHEDALDVLQETFAYFFGKFPGFRLSAQLRTFLYPAVRNFSIARLRKRRPDRELDRAEPELPSVPPDEGAVTRLDIDTLLTSLNEGDREVVSLRFLDGLSLKEIAQALEIPLGTVKSRLHNALRALRDDPRTREHFC